MDSGLRESAARWQARGGPRNRVRPTLVYAGAFLLALVLQDRLEWRIDPIQTGAVQRGAGLLLVASGTALFLWCLALFLDVGTGLMPDRASERLVTSGPYRLSRNPQFVAFTAVYLGSALLLNVAWPIVLLPAAMLITHRFVIRREEQYLTRTFGGAYAAYQTQVRRWL